MHLELPKTRIHSLKDFAKHYLMIVLSILTALGLEAWIEHTHHTHAAEVASQQIEAELQGTLVDVRSCMQNNLKGLESLKALDASVTQDIKAGLPSTVINQHIQAHKDQFTINMSWPNLPSQAWDVSVANQSASWIDTASLRRYSNAYAKQRIENAWITQDSPALNASHMLALRTRIDLSLDVDPVDYLTVLHQMIATVDRTQSLLGQLELQLVSTLPGSDKGAKLAAARTP
ncbi:MAG: hypothetical protein WA777_02025 [Rhodanobacter sp.]